MKSKPTFYCQAYEIVSDVHEFMRQETESDEVLVGFRKVQEWLILTIGILKCAVIYRNNICIQQWN